MNDKSAQISPDSSLIYKLAFDQGLVALKSQDDDLKGVRQRSALVVTLSGLVASLFGKEALKQPSGPSTILEIGTYEWLAILCLIVIFICTILIQWPWKGWIFVNSPKSIISQFAEGCKATDIATTHKCLAEFCDDNFKSNENLIQRLTMCFTVSLLLVIPQLFFWVISLK